MQEQPAPRCTRWSLGLATRSERGDCARREASAVGRRIRPAIGGGRRIRRGRRALPTLREEAIIRSARRCRGPYRLPAGHARAGGELPRRRPIPAAAPVGQALLANAAGARPQLLGSRRLPGSRDTASAASHRCCGSSSSSAQGYAIDDEETAEEACTVSARRYSPPAAAKRWPPSVSLIKASTSASAATKWWRRSSWPRVSQRLGA